MGSKHNVDMSASETEVKVIESLEEEQNTEQKKAAPKKPKRSRSAKYQVIRSQVDKTKAYDPFSAIELVKRLSYSKFSGSVEAHGVVRKEGLSATFAFPHSTGRSVRVAIADDKVLKDIEDGKIDFDVLISVPEYMSKLAKYARVLGPKGLMPNPKNGTVTDDPEAKKKLLEAGSITLKTEKKAPLIHIVFGKTDMESKDLVENLQTLMKAFKDDLLKLSISASMSPGVKVELS